MGVQKQKRDAESEEQMERLRTEIAEAHQDWVNANRYFNYAVGNDQVDYAIYCIIAAEKRYEMLLRSAKQIKVCWQAWGGMIN